MPKIAAPKRTRPDSDYVSESFSNRLKVLEALLDAPSLGYTIRDLERKTGLEWDFVMRTLYTLKDRGYARKFINAWKPGDKCRVFAARANLAFERQDASVLALADSMRNF